MAKVAEGFIHFKVVLFVLVLMAGGTMGFLAYDLILLYQMGFMDIMNLLFEPDFFGLECVFGTTMAGGGDTAPIRNFWSRLNGLATQI